MGRTVLKYTNQEFLNLLKDFGKGVKEGTYKKMDYTIWRTLKNWAEEARYSLMSAEEDCYTDLNGTTHNVWRVGPWDVNKCVPNGIDIEMQDGSFGSYLDVCGAIKECTIDKTILTASAAANCCKSAINSVSNAFADCSKTLAYYDTCLNPIDTWLEDNNSLSNTISTSYSLNVDEGYIQSQIEKFLQQNIETKEEKENKKMNFNFDFGPVDSSVRMSMYGMAIKNANNTYVAYDAKTKQIMDVDIVSFEGASDFMYKMPVAIKDIAVGDVVVHSRKPMFVSAIGKDNRLEVMDIYSGEEKTIVLAQSPFGFNFATKVVSLINFGGADSSNPFGNILPFMLMSNNKSMDSVLPFILMSGQGNIQNNPMMMYALMSKNSNIKDILPFLLMMPNNATGCSCGCNCQCEAEKNQ